MPIHAIPKPTRESRAKREPIDWRGFKFPRPTTVRDKKFAKNAINTYNCLIFKRGDHKCGPKLDNGEILLDFAHVPTDGKRAMGKRASDFGGGVVLCRFGHMTQHSLGWPRFAEKYRIDPKLEAYRIAANYAKWHEGIEE